MKEQTPLCTAVLSEDTALFDNILEEANEYRRERVTDLLTGFEVRCCVSADQTMHQ